MTPHVVRSELKGSKPSIQADIFSQNGVRPEGAFISHEFLIAISSCARCVPEERACVHVCVCACLEIGGCGEGKEC